MPDSSGPSGGTVCLDGFIAICEYGQVNKIININQMGIVLSLTLIIHSTYINNGPINIQYIHLACLTTHIGQLCFVVSCGEFYNQFAVYTYV